MTLSLAAILGERPAAVPSTARVLGSGPHLLVVEDALRPTADALLARHGLVARMAREVPCLPARFGATFPDEDAAVGWLEARRPAVQSALDRVAGRCEVDLRLRPSGAPRADATGPGTQYLRDVAARLSVIDEALLARLSHAARAALPLASEVVADRDGAHVAFLVAFDDVPRFVADARKARLEALLPDGIASRWSGPWPAYTFAAAWVSAA